MFSGVIIKCKNYRLSIKNETEPLEKLRILLKNQKMKQDTENNKNNDHGDEKVKW